MALFQLGRTQEAIGLAARAIRVNPRSADYHSNLGRFHLSLGNLHQAARSAGAALGIEPGHAAARFNLAAALAKMGKTEEAAGHLRQYTAAAPEEPAGHHELGNLLAAAGRHEDAARCFERVIGLAPGMAEPRNNLGNALQAMGLLEEAVQCYQRAIELAPGYADAISNLGSAYQAMGRLDRAEERYRQALAADPGCFAARGNLANLAAARGDAEGAAAEFGKLLAENPDSHQTWNNLGNSLQDSGRYPEAMRAYARALEIKPDYYLVHNNVGNALRKQGRCLDALAAYDRALAADSRFVEAINNKAVALQELGRHAEAFQAFETALAIRPRYTDPMINLANHWREHGRPEKAAGWLRQAVEIEPANAYAWNNLGCALSDQGDPAAAIVCYERALEFQPGNHQAESNVLLNMQYLDGTGPRRILDRHLEFARGHEAPLARLRLHHRNVPDPERPLRVGYVSADFKRHSVAFFAEPLLERHDRSSFTAFCYAAVSRPDSYTARFEQLAGEGWRDLRGASHESFRDLVRADGIDILVDLGGHTANSRLLSMATKPAPVQVSWLGYPATTGLAAIDYRFTDAFADPPGTSEQWHTESLYRLEAGFLCFRPPDRAPEPAPPPHAATGMFTFGCFNNMAKIGPSCVRAWISILEQTPGSRLFVKNKALAEPEARNRFLAQFRGAGIGEERVLLSGLVPSLAAHLDSYRLVDLALDSFPYAGTTTTCEALWMGVPVVTAAGETHVSRVGVSILSLAGLPRFIARDASEYVEIAVRYGNSPSALTEWRSTLRARMAGSALTGEAGFARCVETAYRDMWRRWCRPAGSPGKGDR